MSLEWSEYKPSLTTEVDDALETYLDESPHILSAKDTMLVRQAFEAGWWAKESSKNDKVDEINPDGYFFGVSVALATICLGYFFVEWLKTL